MFKPITPISGRLDNSSGEWIRTTDLLHPIQRQKCPQRIIMSIVSIVSTQFHPGAPVLNQEMRIVIIITN